MSKKGCGFALAFGIPLDLILAFLFMTAINAVGPIQVTYVQALLIMLAMTGAVIAGISPVESGSKE